MKKILFIAAVTILSAVSCNKLENDQITQKSDFPSFEAQVDGAETKTIIDGMNSYWDGTEKIWVLNGLENGDWKKLYKATVQKVQKATFNEDNATVDLSGDDFLAIYPADPANSAKWLGDKQNKATGLWLGNEQKLTEGSYDPATHIAIAYTTKDNLNLDFKNVVSLVKFTINSDNVQEVCFFGNNNENITGNFEVLYNDGDPKATSAGNTKHSHVKISGTFKKSKTYYMAVLPTNFTKGFSVEIVVDGVKHTLKNSSSYTLSRNQIIDLGELTWKIPSYTGKKIIYFKPKGWANDGAWFDAWCWGGGDTWATFKKSGESGIYYTHVPSGTTGMKLYRRGPDHIGNDWDGNQWNNSGDQSLNGKNYITEGNTFGSFTWSNK